MQKNAASLNIRQVQNTGHSIIGAFVPSIIGALLGLRAGLGWVGLGFTLPLTLTPCGNNAPMILGTMPL